MGIIIEADRHPFVVIETKSNIFGNPGDLRSPVEVVPRLPLAPSSPIEETKRPLLLAMALNFR